MTMTNSGGAAATVNKANKVQLQKWLAKMAMQNKGSLIFELEVWIRCFDRFFRIRNHPFTELEMREVVRRDFSEELKIVRSVSLRMSQLCTEIISLERTESDYFGSYVENELVRSDGTLRLERNHASQMTPEDSLSLLIESLADLRPILESITTLPFVNFQTFSSVGKLISRELARCHHIEPLLLQKFKPEFDRIEHQEITAIIKGIHPAELRQQMAQVFLEAFRLLRYLNFIGEDLRADRPLKRSLLIFSLIYSELRSLMDFIDNHLLASNELEEEKRDIIDGCSYGLRMELDKVFGKELIGFVQLRQAPPIYAKVENSHGLLRNCLQQTIIGIAHAFNPNLTGNGIFPDFKTFRDQSRVLRADLWNVIVLLRHYETNVEESYDSNLIEKLVAFRDGSMKHLMFRDWEPYERLYDEFLAAPNVEARRKALHLIAMYLETLLGHVNARAVLVNEPFDYSEASIDEEAIVFAAL